jgi:hypothetical protein
MDRERMTARHPHRAIVERNRGGGRPGAVGVMPEGVPVPRLAADLRVIGVEVATGRSTSRLSQPDEDGCRPAAVVRH